MTNIFKYEPNEFEKSYEVSLAEFVKTIEVKQYEVKESTSSIQEPVKTRKRMSAADWDNCLKK